MFDSREVRERERERESQRETERERERERVIKDKNGFHRAFHLQSKVQQGQKLDNFLSLFQKTHT